MNVVVTGASRGLGRAFALGFAEKATRLAIIGRGLEGLQKLRDELKTINPDLEVLVLSADLSRKFECINAAKSILNAWESLDVLINNAGMYKTAPLSQDSLLDEMLDINLKSAYYLTRELLPVFMEKQTGFIVNVCSALSLEARASAADYVIAKHAMYGFGKALSLEMKPHKVKVLNLLPGSVNTSSWSDIQAPVEEFIQPEDIVRLCMAAIESKSGTWIDEIRLSASNPLY
jgi:short-subunit dehydrogenase